MSDIYKKRKEQPYQPTPGSDADRVVRSSYTSIWNRLVAAKVHQLFDIFEPKECMGDEVTAREGNFKGYVLVRRDVFDRRHITLLSELMPAVEASLEAHSPKKAADRL